jgi:hypothetical protein
MTEKKVIILGSGFSKALHGSMPMTNELTKLVDEKMKSHERTEIQNLWEKHVTKKNIGNILNANEGNFEEILSYLDDCHAWKDGFIKLEHEMLYKAVIPVIAKVIEEASEGINYKELLEKEGGWRKKFIDKIQAEKISVITFNYDLILESLLTESERENLEESFFHFQRYYAIFCRSILAKSGVVPDIGADKDFEIRPTIFKLHGSINWFYKNSHEVLFDETSILEEKEIKYWHINEELSQARIRRVREYYSQLLIPPTQNKTPGYLNIEPIKQQWVEAAKLLSEASKVYIIGYSSPATDISTNLMLQSALNRDDCEVVVCFKKSGEEDKTEERYKNQILPEKSNLKFCREGFGKKFVEEFF